MYKRAVSLIVFGLFFIIFPLIIGMMALLSGELFGFAFTLIFVAVGGLIMKMGINEMHRVDHVLDYGKEYNGLVINFTFDESMRINDQPLVALVVRYYDAEQNIKEIVVPTGSTSKLQYPIGCSVKVLVDESTKEAVVQEKLNTNIDPEGLLMHADQETSSNVVVRREFASCVCPHCGGTLMVANHGTSKCPYCGGLVSLDDFSRTDDLYDVSVQAQSQDW